MTHTLVKKITSKIAHTGEDCQIKMDVVSGCVVVLMSTADDDKEDLSASGDLQNVPKCDHNHVTTLTH